MYLKCVGINFCNSGANFVKKFKSWVTSLGTLKYISLIFYKIYMTSLNQLYGFICDHHGHESSIMWGLRITIYNYEIGHGAL